MDGNKALQYAALVSELAVASEAFLVNNQLPNAADKAGTELTTVRLKTRKHEIIITPGTSRDPRPPPAPRPEPALTPPKRRLPHAPQTASLPLL